MPAPILIGANPQLLVEHARHPTQLLIKCKLALPSMRDCALLPRGKCGNYSVRTPNEARDCALRKLGQFFAATESRRAPMRSLGVALPLFLAFSSSSLFADQVAFKNGDRLTGAILKSDTAILVIKTIVAGEVSVSWSQIQELRSDLPLHVELTDGKMLVGKLATHEAMLEVVTSTGAVEVPKEKIVALRGNAEQSAYERSQRGSLMYGWDGGLDAGFE